MGVIIDGGAADIHRHPGRIAGRERALFPGHGVVENEVHRGLGFRKQLSELGRLPYSFTSRGRPWAAYQPARSDYPADVKGWHASFPEPSFRRNSALGFSQSMDALAKDRAL